MKFRRATKGDNLELNLTPLIDCLLFLIIFFMMTTTFTHASKMQIRLPEAKNQANAPTPAKTIEVEISAAGDYAVNGAALVNHQALTLRSAIEKVSDGQRDMTFIIAADGATPHQSVVTVMDVAGQMGFQNLSISTKLTEDQK